MPVTTSGLRTQMSLNPQMGVEGGRCPPRIAQIESSSDVYFGSKRSPVSFVLI